MKNQPRSQGFPSYLYCNHSIDKMKSPGNEVDEEPLQTILLTEFEVESSDMGFHAYRDIGMPKV